MATYNTNNPMTPDVEFLTHPPTNQYIRVNKHSDIFTDYRQHMEHGGMHPLSMELEQEEYKFIHIGYIRVEGSNIQNSTSKHWLETYHGEALKSFLRDPKVAWAVENSFDGIYVTQEPDYASFETKMCISCYMLGKLAVFWKLKF